MPNDVRTALTSMDFKGDAASDWLLIKHVGCAIRTAVTGYIPHLKP
jgi:hypothetical protein